MNEEFTRDWLKTHCNVSRETMARLENYATMLRHWNKTINLVAPSTLDDLWVRHILDSAQLYPHIPENARRLTDIGSGAGFPALVLAAIAAQDNPALSFCLIESDARKCAFLRNVAREMEINIEILTQRIEQAHPKRACVLTARALAPLVQLLNSAKDLLNKDGICLFLKGKNCAKEIETARQQMSFIENATASISHRDGIVLTVAQIKRGI